METLLILFVESVQAIFVLSSFDFERTQSTKVQFKHIQI